MTTKPVTEKELIEKSEEKGGRRVTLAAIEAAIVGEYYFTAGNACQHTPKHEELDLLSFCVLVLENGFTITGQSACADAKNYDEDLGRRIARQNAINQIWPLMGYELRCQIHREKQLLHEAVVKAQEGFETYIGTKVINARPMSRRDYNDFRGWDLPENEDGNDEGYLVEYTDRIEYPPHVPGYQGYISWSPKDVFERAYKKV